MKPETIVAVNEPTGAELTEIEAKLNSPQEISDILGGIDVDDTTGLYLKEIAQIPLLTAEEELDLAERIDLGRLAREELACGKTSARRQPELKRIIEDGGIAWNNLITANLRLVVSVAKKHIGRGILFLDLINEGNIGLIRSAKKFDYTRGHKFSTYATWWIRQAVERAVEDKGRSIRLPVNLIHKISLLLRARHRLIQELGREPSTQELAEKLEVPIHKVNRWLRASQRPLSLDQPIDEEEDLSLGDFIPSSDPPPYESVIAAGLREKLLNLLESLSPREVQILELHYGLVDGQAHTLEEIGQKMGLSRERIRQVEHEALSRLYLPAALEDLHDYLDTSGSKGTRSKPIQSHNSRDRFLENRRFLLTQKDILPNILNQNEVQVLNLHYGLLNKIPHTLKEISQKMGLSRERIRQIENRALDKITRWRFKQE